MTKYKEFEKWGSEGGRKSAKKASQSMKAYWKRKRTEKEGVDKSVKIPLDK